MTFLYDNFNKKIFINILVEIVIKPYVSNLMNFLDKMSHLFFLKIEALQSESMSRNSLRKY